VSGKELNDLIRQSEEPKEESDITETVILASERSKNLRRAILKFGALAVFAAIIVVFATIAWFASNKNTEANGMSVKVAGMPFEIAVKGSTVRNDSLFTQAVPDYTYGADDIIDGYYISTCEENQIKIRYTPVQNEATDFGPGSSGEILFYVIPASDGDLTVDINLDVIAFKEFGEAGNTTLKPVSELTSDDVDEDVISLCEEGENYLKGHIMFFEEPGETSESVQKQYRYYYKKPIITKVLTKTFTNARAGVPQPVTIYWMWPNTLGQIALRNNDLGQRSADDYPIVQDRADGVDITDTDKGKVIQYLIDNKSTVFANYSEITSAMIEDAKTTANFRKLSEGYNDGDYAIGISISYFMVDITVGLPNGS